MNMDYDKIINLLERVTSGNAGVVDLGCYPESRTFIITWKRPRGLTEHVSYQSRVGMLMYVKQLLEDEGVGVSISLEITQEDFLPES